MASYIALLHKDHDSDFGVSFPDFPGCVTAGKTLDEARQLAREALEFHVEGMIEDGERLPRASGLEQVVQEADVKGALVLLVDLDVTKLSGPAERINISVSKKALRLIDEAAEAAGESRSSFLVRSAVMAGGSARRDMHSGMFASPGGSSSRTYAARKARKR